jgi:hypothetical protein
MVHHIIRHVLFARPTSDERIEMSLVISCHNPTTRELKILVGRISYSQNRDNEVLAPIESLHHYIIICLTCNANPGADNYLTSLCVCIK